MPKRVVVTGGRGYDKPLPVLGALRRHLPIDALAHGGARGADTLAGDAATILGIPVTVFTAEWDKYGRAAGMRRNISMLEEFKPDIVIAFPGGKGTAGCVAEARKRGIAVEEVSDA